MLIQGMSIPAQDDRAGFPETEVCNPSLETYSRFVILSANSTPVPNTQICFFGEWGGGL